MSWKGNGGRYEAGATPAGLLLGGGGNSVGGVGGNVGCWGELLGPAIVCGKPLEDDSLGGVNVGDAVAEERRRLSVNDLFQGVKK